MQAPTPFQEGLQNKIQYTFELKKEVISDKKNKFYLFFKSENNYEISIKAVKEDFIQRIFTNIFSIKVIQENKYFYQFDDLKEICDELSERIEKEKISIIEDTNSIAISIPLPSSKIKEVVFELKENEKSDKKIIKDLMNLVKEQKDEISNLRNELNEFKKETLFILNNYYISNLNSLIIDNNIYNLTLKKWINPYLNIKANLLYRLTRDGPEVSTFHRLCDNKGPTLTLFNLENGYKIGFFVNESFDSVSQWKKDDNCFLFNLNQNKKYKKKTGPEASPNAFNSKEICGPSANYLGCNPNKKLYFIYHSTKKIDKCFENGSKILPSKSDCEIEYKVKETEIFQIIIS